MMTQAAFCHVLCLWYLGMHAGAEVFMGLAPFCLHSTVVVPYMQAALETSLGCASAPGDAVESNILSCYLSLSPVLCDKTFMGDTTHIYLPQRRSPHSTETTKVQLGEARIVWDVRRRVSEKLLIGGDCCISRAHPSVSDSSLTLGTWSTLHSQQTEQDGMSFPGDSGLHLSQAAGLVSGSLQLDLHSLTGRSVVNLVSFGNLLKLFTFLLKEFSHSMRFFRS